MKKAHTHTVWKMQHQLLCATNRYTLLMLKRKRMTRGLCGKVLMAMLLICSHLVASAQQDQGGYIAPSDSLRATYPPTRAIFLPKEGFILFDVPNGEFAGHIRPGILYNAPGGLPFVPPEDSLLYASVSGMKRRPTHIDLSFFFETSDDCFFIPFTQRKDGYVQIADDMMSSWIAIEAIEKAHFRLVPWMDFYGKVGTIVVPPPQTTRPIRHSPYADAEVVVEVDEDYFEVQVIEYDKTTGSCCEGLFCYVRATRYKLHPCYGGGHTKNNIIDVYEGWLQFIDGKGKRLVVHNSGGC